MEKQINEKMVKKIYATLKSHKQIEDEFSKNYSAEYNKVLNMQIIEKLKEISEREKIKKEKQAIFEAAPDELKKINQIKTPGVRMKKKDELINKLLSA